MAVGPAMERKGCRIRRGHGWHRMERHCSFDSCWPRRDAAIGNGCAQICHVSGRGYGCTKCSAPGTNRLVCSPDIFLTNAKSYNNILFDLAGSEGSPCVIFNQMRGFFRWAASLVRVQWWHPPQSRGQHEVIPQPNPSVHPWKSAQDCHTVILAAANTGWAQLVQVRLVCTGGASGLVARQLWCLTVCSLCVDGLIMWVNVDSRIIMMII